MARLRAFMALTLRDVRSNWRSAWDETNDPRALIREAFGGELE